MRQHKNYNKKCILFILCVTRFSISLLLNRFKKKYLLKSILILNCFLIIFDINTILS